MAGAEALKLDGATVDVLIATAASGAIGTVTFWGSLVAFGKLQGLKLFAKNWAFPGQTFINALLLIITLAFGAWLVRSSDPQAYLAITIVASVLGVLLVSPIGGADMPVVIAPIELLFGHRRRRDWLCDRQQRVDHRRVARGRVGHHSDANHV